jgi:hypothetical protein
VNVGTENEDGLTVTLPPLPPADDEQSCSQQRSSVDERTD